MKNINIRSLIPFVSSPGLTVPLAWRVGVVCHSGGMKPNRMARWVLLVMVLAGGTAVRVLADDSAANMQRVRDYWQQVWTEGQPEAVARFYHPECRHGEDFTIAKFQRGVARQRESFPDFNVTIDEIFAVGDRVVTKVTFRGTHTGRKMFGQEPLGRKIEVPGIDIFRFRDGKCVEHLHVADHYDFVTQMGLVLTPTPVAAATK